MQVKLTKDELKTLTISLDIARIIFKNARQIEDYFKVEDLARLLFFTEEITATLIEEHTTPLSPIN